MPVWSICVSLATGLRSLAKKRSDSRITRTYRWIDGAMRGKVLYRALFPEQIMWYCVSGILKVVDSPGIIFFRHKCGFHRLSTVLRAWHSDASACQMGTLCPFVIPLKESLANGNKSLVG